MVDQRLMPGRWEPCWSCGRRESLQIFGSLETVYREGRLAELLQTETFWNNFNPKLQYVTWSKTPKYLTDRRCRLGGLYSAALIDWEHWWLKRHVNQLIWPIWTQPTLDNTSDTVTNISEGLEESEGRSEMGLGSPGNESLICLTMDTGHDQENDCEPLHTSLVTMPQISSDQAGWSHNVILIMNKVFIYFTRKTIYNGNLNIN